MTVSHGDDNTAENLAIEADAVRFPEFAEVQSVLGWTREQWELTVARRRDLVKTQHTDHFVNVTSLRQVIEDAYDDFVESIRLSPDLRQQTANQNYLAFQRRLKIILRKFIVVENTKTFYIPDETTSMPTV